MTRLTATLAMTAVLGSFVMLGCSEPPSNIAPTSVASTSGIAPEQTPEPRPTVQGPPRGAPTAPPVPVLPVPPAPAVNTPIVPPAAAIAAGNAGKITALGTWGKGIVSQVAWSRDGSFVAAATPLGVYVYDAKSLMEVRHLDTQTTVTGWSVRFSPQGTTLVTESRDQILRLWDLSTGRVLWAADRDHGAVFSPDGKTIAARRPSGVALRDAATGSELHTIQTDSPVERLVFSTDGKILAGLGGTADFWDVATGRTIRSIPANSPPISWKAVTPDGNTLVGMSGDGKVRLWDVPSGKELWTLTGCYSGSECVALAPNGKTIALGSYSRVSLWDVTSGKKIRDLPGHDGADASSVAFSQDGKTLATGGSDTSVKLWDVATGQELRTLQGHGSRVGWVAFAPDGETIAAASRGEYWFWDTRSGKDRGTLPGHFGKTAGLAFSPDAALLASASDDWMVRLWDVARGRELWALPAHTSEADALAFTPDGRALATFSRTEGTVRLWEVPSGKKVWELPPNVYQVEAMALSPDGKTIATAGYEKIVRLWDVYSGKEVRAIPQDAEIGSGAHPSTTSMVFLPDGKSIVHASSTGRIWLLDLQSGTDLPVVTAMVSQYRMDNLALAPDGRTLAAAYSSIVLLDVATGDELRRLPRSGPVAFSPDGRIMASGGQTVGVWDAANWRELNVLAGHRERTSSLVFSPDGKVLVSGGADGSIWLWGIR